MLILHVGVSAGSGFLWGETADTTPAQKNAKSRRRAPEGPSSVGAEPEAIQALLGRLLGKPSSKDLGTPQTTTLNLLTLRNRIVPSNPILGELPIPAVPSRVPSVPEEKPWPVQGLVLKPTLLVSFLEQCWPENWNSSKVFLAEETLFWSELLRLAYSLVLRERFIPGIARRDRNTHAVWEPVLSVSDSTRLEELIQTIPASALVGPEGNSSSLTPREVVYRALSLFVDGVVRNSLASQSRENGNGHHPGKRRTDLAPEDRWLQALTLPDSFIAGNQKELGLLQQEVDAWRRPSVNPEKAVARFCFRLDEPRINPSFRRPPAKPEDWRLSFSIQKVDEPSKFFPLFELWRQRQPRHTLGLDFDLRAFCQDSLERASRIFPALEPCLTQARCAEIRLNPTVAWEFLSETSWALEAAGFSVVLPTWWTGRSTRHQLRTELLVSPVNPGDEADSTEDFNPETSAQDTAISLLDTFAYQWQILLGNDVLTPQDLAILIESKAQVLQLRGRWVYLRPDQQSALLDWQSKNEPGGQAPLIDILRWATGAIPGIGDLENVGLKTTHPGLETFWERFTTKSELPSIDSPEGFPEDLLGYQAHCVSWLNFMAQYGLGACLSEDLGLGISAELFAFLLHHRAENTREPSLLLTSPEKLVHWEREARYFASSLATIIIPPISGKPESLDPERIAGKGLIITSPDYVLHHPKFFSDIHWSTLILDHALNTLQEYPSIRGTLAELPVQFRLALIPKSQNQSISCYWSLLQFLNPGWLPLESEFTTRFVWPIQLEQKSSVRNLLQQILNPFNLQSSRSDPLIASQLPESQILPHWCPLTQEQADLHGPLLEEFNHLLDQEDSPERDSKLLELFHQMDHLRVHPSLFLDDPDLSHHGSGKFQRIGHLLQQIHHARERALLIAECPGAGTLLKEYLQGLLGQEFGLITETTRKRQRELTLARFLKDAKRLPFLILNDGTSDPDFSLEGVHHVIVFDALTCPTLTPPPQPPHPKGNHRPITLTPLIHHFLYQGTLEEKIDRIFHSETNIPESPHEALLEGLLELPAEELKSLVKIEPEAVVPTQSVDSEVVAGQDF